VEGEHKTPEFLAKNYSGTLPVLELADGTMLAECTAITQYLDALDGRPVLTGRTPLEQGMIHMMSKRAELELLDAISVYFHHATPGLGRRSNFTRTLNGGCVSVTKRCAAWTISTPCSNISLLWRAILSLWRTLQ
jgi:glutathione S-transferase